MSNPNIVEKIVNVFHYFNNFKTWTISRKDIVLRAFVCWLVASFLLVIDQGENYDMRFKARGSQPVSDQIVLIKISANDIKKMYDLQSNSLINFNDLLDINDSFFWDQNLWHDFISKILSGQPKKVAVALLFSDSLNTSLLSSQEIITFKDPRIIWGTNSGEFERMMIPFAANLERQNVGHFSVLSDDDGISRRLQSNQNKLLNIAQKLTNQKREKESHPLVINFRGTQVFKTLDFKNVLSEKFDASVLKNKLVIIGSDRNPNSQILTPIGPLSRVEYWAHVTDNYLQSRFISPKRIGLNLLLLAIVTVVGVVLISVYPQSVVFLLFIAISSLWGAFSIWIFDTHGIWVPLGAVILLLVLIWVIFIGYFVSKAEETNHALLREQKYLSDLEQLKNNFVSLISHDLKTPISKIQSVVERNLIEKKSLSESELQDIRTYTDELNRYIQSILKVLRVESKDFKINRESVDINEIIFTVAERIRPLALVKNIKIELQLEPIFLVELDATLISEVILNLVENAIKYTPNNGTIHIRSWETDQDLNLEIRDSGEGIAAEDQPNIWKKFVRGQNQDLKSKGTGLGLYLVKYFVELHQGSISFKSELGKGTTFFVRLPIETEISTIEQERGAFS